MRKKDTQKQGQPTQEIVYLNLDELALCFSAIEKGRAESMGRIAIHQGETTVVYARQEEGTERRRIITFPAGMEFPCQSDYLRAPEQESDDRTYLDVVDGGEKE